MALQLKLPDNFRVRTFGSSRNTSGLGKYMMPNVALDAIVGTEAIYISEMRIL